MAGFDARLGAVGTWADFTQALRDFHEHCGSPTYDALAAHSGLSKSAISNLIGRNPLRRPSESATLRFAACCLRIARVADAEADEAIRCWRRTWRRLEGLGTEPAPAPEVPERRSPFMAMGASGVALMAAVVAWVVIAQGEPSSAVTPVAAEARDACQQDESHPTDARLGRVWDGVFVCPNSTTPVHEWADKNSPVIGQLRSNPSWFACWTRRGGEVWYYTQGDDAVAEKHLQAWGFVQAPAVGASDHPDPGVARECTFSTGD